MWIMQFQLLAMTQIRRVHHPKGVDGIPYRIPKECCRKAV